MEEPKNNDFESREYQVELFELAVERNTILYLPTGSGKTFIATLLIIEYGKKSDSPLFLPLPDGGKRSFFLVNTVPLVEQQASQIRSKTTFNVGEYSGDMGVDFWDSSTWLEEINEKQVLVMTCQIFLDLIQSNTITLKNANLLIFDECHRAVSNHPMRQIMKNFKDVPVNDQPRILGLTATLLNGNINPKIVAQEIRTLENTFMAQIATSNNEEMVKMYSTNPEEKKCTYCVNNASGFPYQLRDKILKNLKEFVEVVEVDEVVLPAKGMKPYDSRQIDTKINKTNKRLQNLLADIKTDMDDMGVYGGSISVLAHLVRIQHMLPNSQVVQASLLFQSVIADCVMLRKHLEAQINQLDSSGDAFNQYSSDKVQKLFNILTKLKPEDSAIVFVKRRFAAKILHFIMKRASSDHPRLKNLKSNFIVGYNITNPFKDTRENYLQKNQNRKVMNQFNQGELNVIFASNVVEEGIDITQCNFVIMFDAPQDFRSYVQSKGRARDRNSSYIIMISNADLKFHSKYNAYRDVEEILKKILYGGKSSLRSGPTKAELNANLFVEMPGLEPYKPMGPNGPVITALSAVSLINRYFTSLKADKFTKVVPFWWLKEEATKVKCFLQLPMECKIRGLVEGTWQLRQEDAKRSVALEACKKLHQSGELDDHLLPIGLNDPGIKQLIYTPNRDENEIFEEKVGDKVIRIGTKKHKRVCEKKWAECLCQCRPEPNKKVYMHVLDLKPIYDAPIDNRLRSVHEILSNSNTFAILSSKKLPNLAPFPLYMSTGELEATVKEACVTTLDEVQMQRISNYHRIIFEKVLGVTKLFMIRDLSNTQNAYLIAPVIIGPTQELTIDWEVIEQTNKPFPLSEVMPSKEERANLKITDENYLHRIVSPWYRTVPAQKYLVTQVCYNMSEETTFPTETYATYTEYFKDKYKIEPLIRGQPLLEVRAITSRINSIKPRALTKQLKRKYKEENEDFEVWLLPEFCVVYPLPGRYWIKAQLLPSALHRISQLCMAEELRCRIVCDASVGLHQLSPGSKWDKLQQDCSILKKDSISETIISLTPLLSLSMSSSSEKSSLNVWGVEEEPVDIERQMDTLTIFDIINFRHFVEKPLLSESSNSGTRNALCKLINSNQKQSPLLVMTQPPPLQMLQNNTSSLGPQQVEVMQALTAAVANDFVNCERLETLGDSFLKFAISLILFEAQPDWAEGNLTHVKGIIVGNKNLYYCGKAKNLGSMLEVHDFSPKEDWVAPGFCVERSIQSVIRTAKLNPNCLYNVDIPNEERETGHLSKDTYEVFNDLLFEAEDAAQAQNCTFINQQAVTDKNISDAVEAILGTYLKSCGIYGALAVLNWFGVTSPELATSEVFIGKSSFPAKCPGNPNQHLLQPDYLEKILNYKFKDRCYMLQALTHPSYSRNNITMCYQRLEFLGDALIDFLITVHIYEKCNTLSPGDLTDLRSALVNNITLAALTVRNQLHKFLLHRSSKLSECMSNFVKHQEDRNHVIDDDILFLLEEQNVNISEAVDVPKCLGDIFEALVGAIYLDSGKNINVTWKVIYNFMKNEIDKFHKDVPKNHVRLLYESGYLPHFSSDSIVKNTVMVTVEIMYKGKEIRFNGFGDNKKQAKRAAAKHALRVIRSPSEQ